MLSDLNLGATSRAIATLAVVFFAPLLLTGCKKRPLYAVGESCASNLECEGCLVCKASTCQQPPWHKEPSGEPPCVCEPGDSLCSCAR